MLVKLCDRPRVYLAEDFATAAETRQVLRRGRDPRTAERVGMPATHSMAGLAFEWPIADCPTLALLTARMHELAGIQGDVPLVRFRQYRVGEWHPPHRDVYRIGGRVLLATAILYLNDTHAGGETFFPHARPHPILLHPRRGRLVFWFNYRPDGKVDPAAEHESLAVDRGEKCTIAYFFYCPRADSAREPSAVYYDHHRRGVLRV